VVDGASGRLVPAGDHAAFADALAALGRDPAMRRRLGDGGRALAGERFDAARAAARFEEVLRAARGARHDERPKAGTGTPGAGRMVEVR
jgi:glycosyltransferase involved in cell wall biosynthesis